MMKSPPSPPKAVNLRAFLMIRRRASLQAKQKLFPLMAIYNYIFYLNIGILIDEFDDSFNTSQIALETFESQF
jgi:hypothetical protein